MVAREDVAKVQEVCSPKPIVLSEGASVALGSVFNRLIKPKAAERLAAKSSGKRPRSDRTSTVLAESEDVKELLEKDKEERRKYKEAKKAKLKFENNALVIPDAATGAAREKQFLATATKGAVTLFNAVSKAQKVVEEKHNRKSKRKGPPVSRESFMDMIRAGVQKDSPAEVPNDKLDTDSSGADNDTPKAKWLKPDYMTSGSRKLKDWGKNESEAGETDSSGDDDSEGEG